MQTLTQLADAVDDAMTSGNRWQQIQTIADLVRAARAAEPSGVAEDAARSAPAVPDERAAFEQAYAKIWAEQTGADARRQAQMVLDLKEMRDGNTYGDGRNYLNFKWEGWQERAMLAAAPQPKEGGE
uniref:hypothetical protein n=1 Tax=Chromobacterium amazonense TaxID=1382803 RepID=UPI003F7A695F